MSEQDDVLATSTDRERQLTQSFIELADTLVDDFDAVDLLHQLVVRCVDLFAVTQAGILLRHPGGELRVMGASNEQTHVLELLQVQGDEGPCRDCVISGELVVSHDLAREDRWSSFAPKAVAAGIRSVTAVPLRLRGQVLGALNLFSAAPGALPEPDLHACVGLAHMATIGLLTDRTVRESRRVAEQLQFALDSRILIEQAKGMLAERSALSMDAAFEHLRRHARSNQLLLRDVARQIVDGTLPTRAILPGLDERAEPER